MRIIVIVKKVIKELLCDKWILVLMFVVLVFIMWLMNFMFLVSIMVIVKLVI